MRRDVRRLAGGLLPGGGAVSDLPIIFSAPMVRALLDGRKTNTRRLPSIRGHRSISEFQRSTTDGYDWTFRDAQKRWHDLTHDDLMRRLKWQIGDRLWVREAFRGARGYEGLPPAKWGNKPVWYCADGDPDPRTWWHLSSRARPSIHMPRWASRLTLTVTDVRVQRLQDISEEDARAEGWPGPETDLGYPIIEPRKWFAGLWDALHGPGAWDANQWVVAITFDVRKGNIDEVSL